MHQDLLELSRVLRHLAHDRRHLHEVGPGANHMEKPHCHEFPSLPRMTRISTKSLFVPIRGIRGKKLT